jgi:hypothetical protein
MFKVLGITFALNPLSFLKYGEEQCPTSLHYEVCGQALAKNGSFSSSVKLLRPKKEFCLP